MPELTVRPPDPNPEASSLEVLARVGTAKLEAMGIDWRPIAAAHGLDFSEEMVEGRRIPTHREHAFLAEAAKAAGDPLFSWRLADMSIKDFGLVGYAILNSPTVGDALTTMGALMPTVCEAIFFDVMVDGDTASLVYTSSDSRQNGVFAVNFMVNLLRNVIGPQFAPTRVGLDVTERHNVDVVARQIAGPVTADLPYSFVSFPGRHLRARVLGADERLAATLRPYWERQLAQTRRNPTVLRARIEGAVVQDLPLGVPNIDRLAAKLNIGRSKLTAELSMIGGYRTVVDDVRRRLAKEMVQRTDLTMSSIATHLGFSEPGALNHAYRRWTGRTPTADRESG